MINSKGMATVFIMMAIFVACAGTALIANRYLPEKEANIIESELEQIAEHELEYLLQLPDGSLRADLDIIFHENE